MRYELSAQVKHADTLIRVQESFIFSEAYGGYADRFAVDSTSGNLYFTAVNTSGDGFVGVSVISPRGDHVDIVEGGHKPRDIVVDPEYGYFI